MILLLLPLGARAQSPLADIQKSHIEANMPTKESFDTFLHRDLLAYFHTMGAKTVSHVEYQLLREGPTQSGVAYPKYYLWVKALSANSILYEGAMRVAAIEHTRFEVMHFLSRSQIQTSPSEVGTVFPAPLVASVLSLAGVK
jgi:hypothetical protein